MNKERELAGNEKELVDIREEVKSVEPEEVSHENHDEHEDLGSYSKEELLKLVKNFKLTENPSNDNSFLKDIKNHFDQFVESERNQALHKFIEDGGKEEDFEFRKDQVSQQFDKIFDVLKSKVSESYSKIEKDKEKNLELKNNLLEKLRQLTSSEETTTSINSLKSLQDEWRKIGPVPSGQAQNLWASFNALVEMFYNNRSIYFELKELDRKKNLEAKKELCDKAEKLSESDDVVNAIKELRLLHDEYKHLGPVPKEDQEALWARFKAASDKIYEKRKSYYADQKQQLDENYSKKQELIDKIEKYINFNTEKIDDWKAKTHEVLALQEEWKKIGRIPKDKAKDASKRFWTACKTFFNNKNAFFKQLEIQKEENLKLKVQLCEQAESIKDSDDYKKIAGELKDLQKRWESIGPVPIKMKDEIYKRFKTACDEFFNRRREQFAEVEKEFAENYKNKISIIEKIEALAEKEEKNPDDLKQLQEEWKAIGFVPKNEIKNISDRYNKAIEKYIAGLEKLNPEERDSLSMALQLASLKGSPATDKKLQRKESEIFKRISNLRKEIDRYNTNVLYLSKSSKANQLRDEINSKILEAQNELKTLEKQLKMLKEA